MSLERILMRLKESSLAVFTLADLRRFTGASRETAYVYLSRMVKRGLVYRVEKGRFTIYSDPFLVSAQLVYPSYISFLSALFLHGKTTQTINEILVATSKRKRTMQSFGMRIKFVKLDPRLIFGFKKVKKGNSFIFLAELEKAIIDSLYLPRYCLMSEVFLALKDVDVEKTLEFASKFRIEAVNRRLGYMLDLLGVKADLPIKSKTPYKLNPANKVLGKFDSKWRLYVNEVLE
ncbi:MAG: type IV toxin-antitoxin system AbiEi family antitoxin domain-containing protein [Thermoproteota archaeon]